MPNTQYDTNTKPKLQRPKMYVAVMLNDDFTTFDFVIDILQAVFHKSVQDAEIVAMEIHTSGKGIAGGPFTYEICETKIMEAMDWAKAEGHPLRLGVEEA